MNSPFEGIVKPLPPANIIYCTIFPLLSQYRIGFQCVFLASKKSRKHYFHVRYDVSVAASFKIVGKSWICDNRQLIVNWDAFKSLHNMMKVCLILKSIPILICVKIEKWLFKIFDIWDVFVLKPKRICFIVSKTRIIWKWTV